MKQCPHCKSEILDDSLYCDRCGQQGNSVPTAVVNILSTRLNMNSAKKLLQSLKQSQTPYLMRQIRKSILQH